MLLLSSCGYKDSSKGYLTPLNIVCVGDSITYGYKLPDPAKDSYPTQLSRKATGQWTIANLGVNGATVVTKGDIPYTSQSQYQQLMKMSPDVAVIMLGTNDMKDNNWLFVSDFVQDYSRMVKTIQNLPSHPQVIVCSIPPIFADYPNGLNAERQQQINTLVRNVVELTGAEYLDVSNSLLGKSVFFIDGVHPNNAGAIALANMVFDKLSQL
jgi:sialate O-acetylesterase